MFVAGAPMGPKARALFGFRDGILLLPTTANGAVHPIHPPGVGIRVFKNQHKVEQLNGRDIKFAGMKNLKIYHCRDMAKEKEEPEM